MSSASNATELSSALHTRLCAGDPTATGELAEYFLAPLVSSLRARFFNLRDPDLLEHAAMDALMHYFNNPAHYQPERGPLLPWLKKCATNEALDELRRQKNRGAREEAVELADFEAVYRTEAEAEDRLITRATDEAVWQRLRAVLNDPLDVKLASLLLDGVRDTAVFADALNLKDTSSEELQRIVKRHKDRIKKALQRHY